MTLDPDDAPVSYMLADPCAACGPDDVVATAVCEACRRDLDDAEADLT